MTPAVLAHGFADAADLPVPIQMALLLAGALVVGSAAATDRSVATAGGAARRAPRPLPWLTRLVDAPVTRVAAGSVVGAAAVGVCLVALLGVDRASANPVPRLVYDVGWPSLMLTSALVGPAWRVVNPLRLVVAGLLRVTGQPAHDSAPAPRLLRGLWPAVVTAGVFTWAEQVLPDRPTVTAAALVLIAAVVVIGGVLRGPGWIRRADPFEAAGDIFARLAPLRRGPDGVLAVGRPRTGRRAPLSDAGAGVLVAVLISGHLLDGLTEIPAWQRVLLGQPATLRVAAETALLAVLVAGVAALVRATTGREPALRLGWVPLVAGYAFGHYFPVLPLEAQVVATQLSDPLAAGADLLGTATRPVSVTFLEAEVAALLLLAGITAFHAAAMNVGRTALPERYDTRTAAAIQFGFRGVVLVSVLGGVALRFLG